MLFRVTNVSQNGHKIFNIFLGTQIFGPNFVQRLDVSVALQYLLATQHVFVVRNFEFFCEFEQKTKVLFRTVEYC